MNNGPHANGNLNRQNGKDNIQGGYGKDMRTGVNGADTFFYSWNCGSDVIKDFQDGVDKIELNFSGNVGFPNGLWDYPTTQLQHRGGKIILELIFAAQIELGEIILT